MNRRGAFLVLLLAIGCSKHTPSKPAPSAATPPGAPPAASATAAASAAPARSSASAHPAASASSYSSLTGVLSEEGFKKLHQLKTDAEPPRKGTMIKIAGTRAYLSLPANAKPPLPAVVVIHEWWGLNQHIEHWADRLAADGYAAVAVDLYGGKVATTPDEAMKLMKAVDATRARTTLVAAYHFLKTDPRVTASHLGSIGWCFGGGWSLQLALAEPKLDADVIYYGHVPTDPGKLTPLHAPVLAFFGNKDKSIPPAHVDAFEHALAKLHVTHTVQRYDAQHAFANPSGARYNEKAAADAWKHVRAFLDKYLKHPAKP